MYTNDELEIKCEAAREAAIDARRATQRLSDRIQAAIAYAENNIDGAEESRARDSTLSTIIGILDGSLNFDGVPR